MANVSNPCPLCGSNQTQHRHRLDGRDFIACTDCALIFVPESQFLPFAEEKAQYDYHENDPADPGYRKFLSQLTNPLLEALPPNSKGLDFGCGPGPTLNHIMADAGHQMALYDPIYAPKHAVLKARYDFITATEVAEHLHAPRETFEQLWAMLYPGGWLGLMTWRTDDVEDLATWHYMRDPTHVCFYAEATMTWLAEHLRGELTLINAQTLLLRKME